MNAKVVPEYLRSAAAAGPDRPALILDSDRSVRYGEWCARADRVAAALQARGIRHGDRVGLVYSGADWIDYAVAYFGVLAGGATAVLLPPGLLDAELSHVTEAYHVALVLVGPAEALPEVGCPTVHHTELESAVAQQARPEPVPATPDDVAEIAFTSGTSGSPKGVEATHRSMIFGDKQPDPAVLMHPLPLGSTAAQMLMIDAVRGQQTFVLMAEFDPTRFCKLALEYEPCWLALVSENGALLVRSGVHERFQLPSVGSVTFVNADLRPDDMRQLTRLFPAAVIRNYYSSIEAAPAGVGTVFDPARPASVGRPEDGTVVRVVDDHGGELRAGERGQVLLRTEGVESRRYADDPDGNAVVFRDGWVHTGDIGYFDEDGFLYLVDRKVHTIDVGGEKVSALEVEQVLGRHPAVAEAAVYGRPREGLGEDVAAAVILREPVDPAELLRFCASQLSGHQVPARLDVVDDFPRNAVGKPFKRTLAEQLAGKPADAEVRR
jgi:long-chain acyl-CoA synthetase